MLKTRILFIILLIMSIIAGGCTPLFIKENEPVILQDQRTTADTEFTIQSNNNMNISIESVNSKLTDGIVWDISRDGMDLLVSDFTENLLQQDGQPTSDQILNMGSYNFDTDQYNPFLISTKNQFNGFVDYKNKGYYYLENTESNPALQPRYRLLWSDLEGDATKSISSSDENISPGYSLVNDDLIIYGNQRGEIRLVNRESTLTKPDGTSRVYQLSKRLAIMQIDLWEEENMAVFGAYDNDTKTYNLYLASLTKQNPEPVMIQENVFYFQLSREAGKLLYSASGEREMQRLILYDLKNASHKVLKNSYLGLFAFTRLGDKIVYSERADSSSNSQNLWIMDQEGNNATQLASNVNIYGYRVVFHPYQTTIYFTVFDIGDNTKDTQNINYSVFSIDYSLY